MKMTRESLKSLVKECLLEILTEGLGSASVGINKRVTTEARRSSTRSSGLDQPISRNQQSDVLKRAVLAESGGNPVLATILADTAATTLPKMLANDRHGAMVPHGGAVEMEVARSTPEELFGEEASSRWASLAFSDDVSKKSVQ